jgi:hypothetical protein
MKFRLAWLALLPVAGLLAGGYLSEHVRPLVFGLPFLLLWNSGWVLTTSVVLTLIYHFDPDNRAEDE